MTNINNGVLDGLRRLAAKVRGVDIDGGAPGAPLGYRLRGATGAGYPQSGTWKTRDVVPDGAGNIWVNTGKGEPGTWAQAGFGRRAKLQGWYAGLANRPYNSVAVLCLGDSVTEGANDFNNGTSPAALYSNLKTLIATIRAAFTAVNFTPAPPILLLSLPQQNDGNSWSPYLAALYSLAAGDPMTDVLDLALRMPSATAAQQWGLVSSGEFSDAGMSMIADAICEFLSPQ